VGKARHPGKTTTNLDEKVRSHRICLQVQAAPSDRCSLSPVGAALSLMSIKYFPKFLVHPAVRAVAAVWRGLSPHLSPGGVYPRCSHLGAPPEHCCLYATHVNVG
jgi:hypothetical protein